MPDQITRLPEDHPITVELRRLAPDLPLLYIEDSYSVFPPQPARGWGHRYYHSFTVNDDAYYPAGVCAVWLPSDLRFTDDFQASDLNMADVTLMLKPILKRLRMSIAYHNKPREPRTSEITPQMSLVDVFSELDWCWDAYKPTPRSEYVFKGWDGQYTRREYFKVLLDLAKVALNPVQSTTELLQSLDQKLASYRSDSRGLALSSDRHRPQTRSHRAYIAFRELHRHVRRALHKPVEKPSPLAPVFAGDEYSPDGSLAPVISRE